ncbi:hypothetical protein NRF20_05950 [Streptomyces sp. R-74717]
MEAERGLERGTRLPGAGTDGLVADGFRQEGDELFLAAADEVLLGAEVAEEGALRDAGFAGDLRDGRLVVSLLREQALRGLEDLLGGQLSRAIPQRPSRQREPASHPNSSPRPR